MPGTLLGARDRRVRKIRVHSPGSFLPMEGCNKPEIWIVCRASDCGGDRKVWQHRDQLHGGNFSMDWDGERGWFQDDFHKGHETYIP